MNLAELAAEVTTRVGAATDDQMLTTSVIRGFVRSGLRHVEADLDSPDWLRTRETISTVAGLDSYEVPADWAKTLSLRVAEYDWHLEYVGFEALDADYGTQQVDGTGRPAAWTQEGGFLIVRPVPAGVFNLEHRYLRTETDLLADADVPLLPARFHDAIVEKAAGMALRRIGEYDRAGAHEADYQGWLGKIVDELNRVTKAPRIRTR